MDPSREERRRHRIRLTLGWAYWPFFVWRRVSPEERAGPGPVPSILHTGYFFSAVAVVVDGALLLHLRHPSALLFLLAHLLWISLFVSLLLLNPRFLEHLDGRPLRRLGWANRLTLARAFLLPLLLCLLWLRLWTTALGAYVLLAVSDVADGAVARRLHEESKLGFVLDPFVDILFHLGILLTLTAAGVLSGWTGALVAVRYGLLLVGCAFLYLWKGEIWIQPTPFGKATGLAIACVSGLLLLLLGIGALRPLWQRGCDLVLRVLFAATVIHVITIGWINMRRPPHGGFAVYRKGWGLLLGQGRGTGAKKSG